MRSLLHIILVPPLLQLVPHKDNGASAQEVPTFPKEMFAKDVWFRQNLCERQSQLHTGNTTIRDALRGLEIHAAIFPADTLGFYNIDEETGGIDSVNPGLLPVILDELADRAGFTWRNSFALLPDLPEDYDKTWTDLVAWSSDVYDLSVGFYTHTTERLSKGVNFPEGWYDGSLVMVGDNGEKDASTSADLWGWLEPFTNEVWAMILVTLLISGLVYWIMDWIDHGGELQMRKAVDNIFSAMFAFVWNVKFDYKTIPATFFVFSLSFFSLLIFCAYVSNLANIFVVEHTPNFQFHTVAEVAKANLPICVWSGTAMEDALRGTFPTANIVSKPTYPEIYRGVLSGECLVALTEAYGWEASALLEETNGDCNLGWVGRVFKFLPAGFATKADHGTLCSSLISDAVNVHLREMKADGFLSKAWEDHLIQNTEVHCSDHGTLTDGHEEGNNQLDLRELTGVFFLHFLISAFALLLSVLNWANKRYKKSSVTKLVESFNLADRSTAEKQAPEELPQTPPSVNGAQLVGILLGEMRNDMNKQLAEIVRTVESMERTKTIGTSDEQVA